MIGSNSPKLRYPKPRARVLERRVKRANNQATLAAMRKAVKARDHGLCRVCGKAGNQVHHLVYRSKGGKHHPNNGIWVCARDQQDIHAKLIIVAWVGKNPARTVRFRRLA